MIKIDHLSKHFKVHQKNPGILGSVKSLFAREYILKKAVDDISLEIEEGEILGLIGSNGAGKTTLVKMLSGIIHPTYGSASVYGHTPWERSHEYRSMMSLIMGQKAQLWWDLPALDGLLLLKEIYRIPKKEYEDHLDFLAQTLGIKDQLKVQVRKLSLGERMKVELIAALIHKPKVIFLDEPTIGLDLTAQKAVRNFIIEYRKQYKTIMILTSHYMEDIERLCKRIAIIKSGQFIYDGSLKEVQNRFDNERTIRAEALDLPQTLVTLPDNLGTMKVGPEGVICLSTKKETISEASQFLFRHFKIKDFQVSQTEIGTIIEKMMLGNHE